MGKVIAIDGPAGAGKGTLAKELAKKLGYVNIDTGATYRCVALEVLRKGISIDDTSKIIDISSNIKIDLLEDGTVLLNGEDVTKDIRSKDVTNIVSPISSIVKVRENMVNIQRNIALDKDVVMEGRDITTVVFPNAQYKFYLDASIDERARRRFEENKEKGINMTYEEVYNNIKDRDYNDMHKEVGALTRTDEQVYIDCTNMTVEEEIEIILKEINK
ncbi:MAG: (d)CMP kinase [Bacilli bacterium]|nr:(d)CMP kinase [Bacilli bacterium]